MATESSKNFDELVKSNQKSLAALKKASKQLEATLRRVSLKL